MMTEEREAALAVCSCSVTAKRAVSVELPALNKTGEDQEGCYGGERRC